MSTVIPKVSRLSPNVLRILGCNPSPMTLQGTNTYLVGSGSSRVLVDSGQGGVTLWREGLGSVLHTEGCNIDKLILTHWHPDHVGGVQEVKDLVKDSLTVYKWPRLDGPEPRCLERIEVQPLEDGQQVDTEGAQLTVYHTPGHTTDHVILHLREENAVFSGDCILGEGTTVFESLHHYMTSLNKILELQPRKIYPGHGPVIEDPIEKIQYYIQHRQEREDQVLHCLASTSQPVSSMDIVLSVYTTTPEHLHQAANTNVLHHLDKLMVEGKVVQEGQGWRLV